MDTMDMMTMDIDHDTMMDTDMTNIATLTQIIMMTIIKK